MKCASHCPSGNSDTPVQTPDAQSGHPPTPGCRTRFGSPACLYVPQNSVRSTARWAAVHGRSPKAPLPDDCRRVIRVKMLQEPDRHAAWHMNAAAAEGQRADDPCPVGVRVLFGIRLYHSIDCKPAQALAGNDDEPQQRRGEDPAVRHCQIPCEHCGKSRHRLIAHTPTQEHVSCQDHERG